MDLGSGKCDKQAFECLYHYSRTEILDLDLEILIPLLVICKKLTQVWVGPGSMVEILDNL